MTYLSTYIYVRCSLTWDCVETAKGIWTVIKPNSTTRIKHNFVWLILKFDKETLSRAVTHGRITMRTDIPGPCLLECS